MGSFEYPGLTHTHSFGSEVSGVVLTYSATSYNFAVCIVSVGLDGFAQSVHMRWKQSPNCREQSQDMNKVDAQVSLVSIDGVR